MNFLQRFMSKKVENCHHSVNILLKNQNCFAHILRTDRDILYKKNPTDSISAKLRLSALKLLVYGNILGDFRTKFEKNRRQKISW